MSSGLPFFFSRIAVGFSYFNVFLAEKTHEGRPSENEGRHIEARQVKRHTSQHTTKGKHIKKASKHTKREKAIENDLFFHFHWFSYFWGFLPQKEAKRKEARAHVICSNRRRKKKLDTHENHRKKQPHVNTHRKDTRVNTQQREITSTSKRNENTPKGKTQLKTICLSCSLFFLILGISPTKRGKAQRGESTLHLHQ